ncbi:MAG: TlpA disulfide reductase family protein [Gammaproteobacteria bacterium]
MKNILSVLVFVVSLVLGQHALAATVGSPAPEIQLKSLQDGSPVSLSSLRGKVVLVDFWASWCVPCRKSLPMFNDLRAKIGPDRFEILAVNLDENVNDAMGFLKQYPVSYPAVWDQNQSMPEQYGVMGMPSSYLVDQNGVLKKNHNGFNEADIGKYEQEIRALLGQ